MVQKYYQGVAMEYASEIEKLWQKRDSISQNGNESFAAKSLIHSVIEKLDDGEIRVAEKIGENWVTNEWVKKAILLSFKTNSAEVIKSGYNSWIDKIAPKFGEDSAEELRSLGSRIVPGSYIRKGSFIGRNCVIMPSFINVGAFIDDGTMIDTWATVGSCAQIGKNCHISGGVGIGGVLEPLQANPVIIEDNCFIGARSEVAEGVIVEEGAVLSMGLYLSGSTKIFNRRTGEISYGKIPAYSVVVPGTIPDSKGSIASLYAAIIVKEVDKSTREKTSINQLLRENVNE